ncbi:MAG: hypothetical protein IKN38_03480 [Clostridia bacterium]|nr:hypothetical protein [Clostridia bacterium]
MKYKIKDYPDIKTKVENMSVDELLSSVIIPYISTGFGKICRDTPAMFVFTAPFDDCVNFVRQINDGRKERALIVSDMEHGAGSALKGAVHFPSMRAVVRCGDPEIAYKMGEYAAKEVRLAGYHWTFGPCVDLTTNPTNPIVSIRAASGDPDETIAYAGAYMRGLQDNGLIATLKHFPGDGICTDDQHVTVPENPLSKTKWMKTYGKVYRKLINDGAMTIMPGHISLPAFDEKDEYMDMYPPASLSRRILTDLLRGELGFEGIIVSDAVNMGGFAGYMNVYRANAAFLEAGGDLLLFQHEDEAYYREMKRVIDEGALSLETLKDRAYRNLCFSREYFETHTDVPKFNRREAEACSKYVAKTAVELYRDRPKALPMKLTKSSKVLHVIFTEVDYPDEAAPDLTERLKALCGTVDVIDDARPWIIKDAVINGGYDAVFVTAGVFPTYGVDTIKLTGVLARNMMEGWTRYGTPCVFVCHGDPIFAEQFKGLCDTVINTYGYNKYTNERVMEIITGKKRV